MVGMSKWVQGTVTGNVRWTDRLHSLQVEAPEVTFVAGQFGRLALPAPPGSKEEMLGRPYSFVNAPGSSPHEFYFVTVPEGPLSPRLAALAPGDPVWLLRNANGFFSVGEVPDADVLWCLATGTGLGPFLSILRTPDPWASFGRIVLVHAVRHANELAYRDVIAANRGRPSGRVHVHSDGEPRSARRRPRRTDSRRDPSTAASNPARGCRSPRRTRTRCSAAIRRWSTTRKRRSPRAACAGTAGGSRGTSRSRRTGDVPAQAAARWQASPGFMTQAPAMPATAGRVGGSRGRPWVSP